MPMDLNTDLGQFDNVDANLRRLESVWEVLAVSFRRATCLCIRDERPCLLTLLVACSRARATLYDRPSERTPEEQDLASAAHERRSVQRPIATVGAHPSEASCRAPRHSRGRDRIPGRLAHAARGHAVVDPTRADDIRTGQACAETARARRTDDNRARIPTRTRAATFSDVHLRVGADLDGLC